MPRQEDDSAEILISCREKVQQFRELYCEVYEQAGLLWGKEDFTLANLEELSAAIGGQKIISGDTKKLVQKLRKFEEALDELENENDRASEIIQNIVEADEKPDRPTYDIACGIVFRYDGSLDKLRKSSKYAKKLFLSEEARRLKAELEAQKKKHDGYVSEIASRGNYSAWASEQLIKDYEKTREENKFLRERNETLEDVNRDLRSDLQNTKRDLGNAEVKIKELGEQNTKDARTISTVKRAYQGRKQVLETKEADLNKAHKLIPQLRESEKMLKQKNEDLERQLSASHLHCAELEKGLDAARKMNTKVRQRSRTLLQNSLLNNASDMDFVDMLLETKSEIIRAREAVIHGQNNTVVELRATVHSIEGQLKTEKKASKDLLKAKNELKDHIVQIRETTEDMSHRKDMQKETQGSEKDLFRIIANLKRVHVKSSQWKQKSEELERGIENTKAHYLACLSQSLASFLPQSCKGSQVLSEISAMLVGLETWELSIQPCRPCWSFDFRKRTSESEEEFISRYSACESFEIAALLYSFVREKQCDSFTPIALLSILASQISSCTDIACAMTLVMCCMKYVQQPVPASNLRPWFTIIMCEVGRYTWEAYPELWARVGQSYKEFCSVLNMYMKQTETLFSRLHHFVQKPDPSLVGLDELFGSDLLNDFIPLVSSDDTQWVLMIDTSSPSVSLLPKSSFVREREDPLDEEVRYKFKDEKDSRNLTWSYGRYGESARWWRRCILSSIELSPEDEELLSQLQSGVDLLAGLDLSEKTGRVPD